MNQALLVVEDDADLRNALEDTLSLHGYDVASATDGSEAIARLGKEQFSLVLSDVQMAPVGGLELLQHIQQKHADIPVILMTAYGSIEQAVQAMQCGAMNYLAKPFEASELVSMVEQYLRTAPADELIAEDPRSRELVKLAEKLAQNDLTVLISGESGTGKEVYARYLHKKSARCTAPFVAVNCAAIPENMLEAVLFGYERGAFTGAQTAHAGKFEQAQGGTLLLDEISEMDPSLQAKLLRVLQEKQVERLGGRNVIDLDVRVLATTNRDLKSAVNNGDFREDLFYRLNVLPLVVPALRDRPGDILPLARSVLARSSNGQVCEFSSAAEAQLLNYHWPGNVRELENLIQRAQVLADGSMLDTQHLQFEADARVVYVDIEEETHAEIANLEERLRAHERELIFDALRQGDGNRESTAALLGISPRTLRHKLARIREEGLAIPGN